MTLDLVEFLPGALKFPQGKISPGQFKPGKIISGVCQQHALKRQYAERHATGIDCRDPKYVIEQWISHEFRVLKTQFIGFPGMLTLNKRLHLIRDGTQAWSARPGNRKWGNRWRRD